MRDQRRTFIAFVVVFYFILGIYAVVTKDTYAIFDRFFSSILALGALFIYKKIRLSWPFVIVGFCTLLLHNLNLYGTSPFGLPFDRYMHFMAGLTLSIIFFNYLIKTEKKKNYAKIIIFSICIAAGICSFVEILEFVGYSYLGEGEGLLFYGTGDFGEWNNVSWDLISNTTGAITGAFMMLILSRKWLRKTMLIIPFIILSIFLFLPQNSTEENDFQRIIADAEIPREKLISDLSGQLENDISEFSKGDIELVLGRINNGDVCKAVPNFENYLREAEDSELAALAHETIASLNCSGTNRNEHLLLASHLWEELGNNFRAQVDKKLANGENLRFYFRKYDISKIEKPVPDEIVIGKSEIELSADDILLTQTDRVTRDWLSGQLSQNPFGEENLLVFSERYFLDELHEDIGWHEGARVDELKQINLTHLKAAGTLAKRFDGKWYAPDEHGTFRFEIPEDKLMYPTTRFLRDDLAIIIDTHGINMLVEQAIRYNATAVLGCCDHIGKIHAADYLAGKGIKVICQTDRILPELLFSENTKNIIGSAPIEIRGSKAIIGNRPIAIARTDLIIATDVPQDSKYALFYYDTPARYFRQLDYNVRYVNITDFNQMSDVIEKARRLDAEFIAVRVYNKDDYEHVKSWLDEGKKAILFHSYSYPYGYMLFRDYPVQTSFGDIGVLT